MKLSVVAAALSVALLISPAWAEPSRIAIVVPAHPDALVREAATRLAAELTSAGFAVTRVEAAPGLDPRETVEGAAPGSLATVAIVRTDRGAAADVWVADHVSKKTLVRRIDTDATAEASLPAALAIRAVELLRASLLEVSTAPEPRPAPPPDVARWMSDPAPPTPEPRKKPEPHALLERFDLELGITALYGMGDTAGRLAPTLRAGYGTAGGIAGRIALTATATDQIAMLEIAYGFDRSWRTIVPVLSLGAGGAHTHIEPSGTLRAKDLRTRAWSAVMGGSAGVAVRSSDRVAFLLDAHALLAEPASGSIVSGVSAAGKPEILGLASLGVLASFF